MSVYKPRIKNSELLRCMLALCLAEDNIYRRLYRSLKGDIKERFRNRMLNSEDALNGASKLTETSLIFGIASNTLSDTVLLPSKTSVNRDTLSNIVRRSRRFHQTYLEMKPDSELKYLSPLEWDDFDPEVIQHNQRESHLLTFAKKLGFCKREGKNGPFILKGGQVDLDKMALIKAIDRKKNIVNKPGCGVNIDRKMASRLFNRYQGVYALYYPAGFRNDDEQGYFMAAMRVSHTLELDNSKCSVIRVKLNVPNVTHDVARYQYRGYLTPIGNKDHLNIIFNLATNTINREECMPGEPPLDPDTVNVLCTRMRGTDSIFRGILTSLSQSDSGYSRLPYAAKVLIKKQEFKGTEEQIHAAEVRFMQADGLGYFSAFESLMECIECRKEAESVQNYFGRPSREPELMYSELLL